MNPLRKLFAFYIDSSIHVALTVSSLVIITWLEYDLPLQKELLAFVFFGSVSGYNFVKYAEVAGLHHRSLTKSLRAIQIFSFLCLVPLFYLAFQIPLKTLLWTAFFGLLTLLYAIPFVNKRSLRTLSGIKVFVVGAVWAGLTVIIPWVSSRHYFETDIWISFVQRLIFVVALLLPFEIRDLKYDRKLLGTIPQQLGIYKTKLLGSILAIIMVLFDLFKDEMSWPHFLSVLLTGILVVVVVWRSKETQTKYFASFWVEALPVFWLAVLYGYIYLDIS